MFLNRQKTQHPYSIPPCAPSGPMAPAEMALHPPAIFCTHRGFCLVGTMAEDHTRGLKAIEMVVFQFWRPGL